MERHLNSTTAPEGTSTSYYEMPQYWGQPQGWICPKCGAVMAPTMMWCINCINGNKTEITTIPHTLPKTVVYNGPVPEINLGKE